MFKFLFIGATYRFPQCYQTECLFHGLRNLDNLIVIDSPKREDMYFDTFLDDHKSKLDLYGRGFTIFGTLPNCNIDRSEIEDKILNKYFDYIVFGRGLLGSNKYLNLVLTRYTPDKIVFVDDRDKDWIFEDLVKQGFIYFKRELSDYRKDIFPIHFGFPKEKIQEKLPKIRKDSIVNPTKGLWADKISKNYIYNNEQDYYDDYRVSLFGRTHKKGGWDCLRHYEIMACRSIPYWTDIEECPELTCTNMPKQLLIQAKALYDNDFEYFLTSEGLDRYNSLEEKIFNHFMGNCTTEALADYFLSVLLSFK